jgi:hypothetical protein
MKNLLVPAAIAIGGLFVVNHLKDAGQVTDIHHVASKHNPARHHRHFVQNEVAAPAVEVQSNTLRVAHFAPIAEVVTASFLIDFSDEQSQMADQDMINQMEESLVEISIPDVTLADAEIIGNFTAKF